MGRCQKSEHFYTMVNTFVKNLFQKNKSIGEIISVHFYLCCEIKLTNAITTADPVLPKKPWNMKVIVKEGWANEHKDIDWNKKRNKKSYAVIFLSTQQSWRSILWVSDKLTGLGPPLSRRAQFCCPAGGGEAFRVPFSIMPCWVKLKPLKEVKKKSTYCTEDFFVQRYKSQGEGSVYRQYRYTQINRWIKIWIKVMKTCVKNLCTNEYYHHSVIAQVCNYKQTLVHSGVHALNSFSLYLIVLDDLPCLGWRPYQIAVKASHLWWHICYCGPFASPTYIE